MWWCRYKVIRRLWPAVVLVGGFCWSQALDFYKGIPSDDKIKQYDAGLLLIPEFYRMRYDVETLKTDLSHDRALSEKQREEILKRIDSLDDKLSRWFEAASKPRAGK